MAEFIYYFYLCCFLISGVCIGSFINVVIYRLPLSLYIRDSDLESSDLNLFWPPSHCPVCQKGILKRDNIPVLSWLLLKGRCRFCRSDISVFYPLTEFIHGVWFTAAFLIYYPQQPVYSIIPVAMLFALLYTISVIDIKHYIIPDSLNSLLLWAGLLLSVTKVTQISPLSAVTGVCIIWLVTSSVMLLYEKFRKHPGLGGGDVKLFAAAMPWVGVEKMHFLILSSCLTGVGFMLWFRLSGKADQYYRDVCELRSQGYIPFGPAICLSAFFLFLTSLL